MPSIPLAEAMIVWTANREPWLDAPNAAPPGSIAVVHWPDDRSAWTRYPSSTGACDLDWRDGDDDYRLQRLANLVRQFAEQDNMNMEHVVEAFMAIEGIENLTDFRPQARPEQD